MIANSSTRIAPSGVSHVGAEPAWFIFKNLHVIGTMVGSMKDTDKALNFAARVRTSSWEMLAIAPLITINRDCSNRYMRSIQSADCRKLFKS